MAAGGAPRVHGGAERAAIWREAAQLVARPPHVAVGLSRRACHGTDC